jgi:integrase/recombinase XerD
MSGNRDPQRRALPLAEWPQADQAAWARALEEPDPFDPHVGYAMRWKPSSREEVVRGYGRWLGYLQRDGKLDPSSSPGSRVTRDAVRAYKAALVDMDNADYTVAGRIKQLGEALKAMDPDGDWSWIMTASSRLHNCAVPARDLTARMQPAEQVFQLGVDLMHAAEHDRFRTPVDRATMFRDGLAIAFLVLRPLRRANLTQLAIGIDLQKAEDGWTLFIRGEETKNSEVIEGRWPGDLVDQLERYLSLHRKNLLKCGGDVATNALWISKRGGPMTSAALWFQVRDRSKETFGVPINLHTFRHIAATTIATSSPDRAADIMQVLGHASLRSSEKYYNRANRLSAGIAYHRTLKSLQMEKKRAD